MTCVHLQHLYKLCQQNDIKLSGSDLLHVVCQQCGVKDECPSMLMEEYEAEHPEEESPAPSPPASGS